MSRYYIDERVGCIAVRDKTLDDAWESGLHEHTTGVIKYAMGERVESGEWEVSSELREEMSSHMNELNWIERLNKSTGCKH